MSAIAVGLLQSQPLSGPKIAWIAAPWASVAVQ
jgi:hypothetical protein